MSIKSALEIDYPSSDGKPMADNTLQFKWIVIIKENLERVFRDDPNVFIAGDLLWYPVEGEPNIVRAPDAMVAFGRPKGERLSYKQWEEYDIPPQVVFEILSKSNSPTDTADMEDFYEYHGVDEFYWYDPDRQRLRGFRRKGGVLTKIAEMRGWVSPRLGIRFEMTDDLAIYGPDGERFKTVIEWADERDQQIQRANAAEEQVKELRRLLQLRGIDPNAPTS